MTKAKKRKRQQGCDVAKVIDTIEKTAAMVIKIYRAVEPIARTILKNGGKTK
jgi:hypothetical protein